MRTFFEAHNEKLKASIPLLRQQEAQLKQLDSWWNKISLVGKINSLRLGSTILESMNLTQQRFNELKHTLLHNLLQEQTQKVLLRDTANSQIAIDILIRNLFERTADIGFLATDQSIRQFYKHRTESLHTSLVEKLKTYIRYYSVYDDIVLLDLQGKILLQLHAQHNLASSAEPLIKQSLQQADSYTETFRYSELQPHKALSLIYSKPVTDETGKPLGILCLCFNIEDELHTIFHHLLQNNHDSIFVLLEKTGCIAYSTSPEQLPTGSRLPNTERYSVAKLAGQDYLVSYAKTQGYQEYFGPDWQIQMWTPLSRLAEFTDDNTQWQVNNQRLFPELYAIERASSTVNDELSLVVLNGEIAAARKAVSEFIPVLDAIRHIGENIYQTFSASIKKLSDTILSGQLEQLATLANLAVDIMDRNLYERANDCRWWAQNNNFRHLLQKQPITNNELAELSNELSYINELYTVYSAICLYDTQLKIIASSSAAITSGQYLSADNSAKSAAAACLQLTNAHQYTVSPFLATALYQNQPTYIYNAPIMHTTVPKHIIGGIALIFDSTPQFEAMLLDILPKNEQGQPNTTYSACFIDETARVLATTHSTLWPPGEQLAIPSSCLPPPDSGAVTLKFMLKNHWYLTGIAISKGYREYKVTDGYQNTLYACILLACD